MTPVTAPSRSHRPATRRRRRLLVVVALAVIALLGTACAQDNTPQTYDAQDNLDQTNFMQGCTGEGTGTTLASTDACQCALDWIMANIPASETDKKERDGGQTFATYDGPTFIQINNDLKNDPNKLPDFVKDGLAQNCASKGYKGAGANPGPTVTSTTAGSATSTPQ